MSTKPTTHLSKDILKLINLRGWERLTDIQEKSISFILRGYNVLIVAPTGYGKTEAALLPILDMMIREQTLPVSLLYITPLKALINDITARIKWWASRLGLGVARKHGDTPQAERNNRLRSIPHIMVTTPESLEVDLDWAPRFRRHYSNLRWVIIDEVHELVQTKRGVQLAFLVERLRRLTQRDLQIIGLSATIGDPETVAKVLFYGSRRKHIVISSNYTKPIKIIIDSCASRSETSEDLWKCIGEKVRKHIVKPTLIFVNSRFTAERLNEVLEKEGLRNVYVHHSSVSRELRSLAEEKLRKGLLEGVACTKTLELGIDIGKIKRVIQIRSTGNVASLLQRVGRSGHGIHRVSEGVIIATDYMDLLESLATAVLVSKDELEPPQILKKPLDVLARQILALTLQHGEIDVKEVYDIARKTFFFKDLQKEELQKVINYMQKLGAIILQNSKNSNKIKIGPSFYKLWRFNNKDKKWWSKNFTEFFSFISERSSFTVKYEDKVIGDIDASFVFKYLRVGDTIRLGGKNWRVVEIDDNLSKIDVVPVEDKEAEIPLWRGEGSRRSKVLVDKVYEIINAISRKDRLPEDVLCDPQKVVLTEDAIEDLNKLKKLLNNISPYMPGERTVAIEEDENEYYFLVRASQNTIETLAMFFLYLVSKNETLNTYSRVSPFGFMIRSQSDPVDLLRKTSLERLKKELTDAIRNSPILHLMIRDIQASFGKIGKVNDEDSIIQEEALRQASILYYDIESALEILRGIITGEYKLVKSKQRGSLIVQYIRKMPAIRLWLPSITALILDNLNGIALTVDELSDILSLPAKSIENKLKDLRKCEDPERRVFQFIDVELGEWRWGLVKDLENILVSEEFSESFKPQDINEAFIAMIKPQQGSSYISVLFTPREIIDNCEYLRSKIPVDDIYEYKVVPISDELLKSLSPKYYHVRKDIVCEITLNAVTFLQKLKRYS